MLSLDDSRWAELRGGYGDLFDPRSLLLRLRQGEDVWDDLWENLHHQGDVGIASYAAVPHLIHIASSLSLRDWNLFSLVSTIEIERHRKSNPQLPDWLAEGYWQAWTRLLTLALSDLANHTDKTTTRSIIGAIAIAKGLLKLGALISYSDDSEISEVLEQQYDWSSIY